MLFYHKEAGGCSMRAAVYARLSQGHKDLQKAQQKLIFRCIWQGQDTCLACFKYCHQITTQLAINLCKIQVTQIRTHAIRLRKLRQLCKLSVLFGYFRQVCLKKKHHSWVSKCLCFKIIFFLENCNQNGCASLT